MTTHDVAFASEGRTLRGWLLLPDGEAPFPAIAMSAGFCGVKEGFLAHPFHEVFVDAGFAVLLWDHANCGESDGAPRQELDPILQQRGYRDAITYLAAHALIDADRIGIWGTSYSGGHVLGVAASDRRVRCVVSQAMTISGHANLLRRHTPEGYVALHQEWAADRLHRAAGEPARTIPAFGPDSDTVRYQAQHPAPRWRNEVTVRSWELYDEYEPGAFVERISPTPLLMIVARDDTMTPAADALGAFERALEPKRLVLVPGPHYAVYSDAYATTSAAARDWFVEHLGSS